MRSSRSWDRRYPSAEVRPVRQVMEGETRVLGKTRATLLSASVADRSHCGSLRALNFDGMGI